MAAVVFTTTALAAAGVTARTPADATQGGALSAGLASSYQADGTVWSMTYAQGRIWLAGDFSNLRPPGVDPGVADVAAPNLGVLDASTGEPTSTVDFQSTHTFTPSPAFNQTPFFQGVIAADAAQTTVYAGGAFSDVDGEPRDNIAAFDASTGALTAFAPQVHGKVDAIAAVGNVVYVGGTFTSVGVGSTNVVRNNLAAFDATTGDLLPWAPSANSTVDTLAVTPDGSVVAAGGYFDSINGQPESDRAALIDGSSGTVLPMAADEVVPPTSAVCSTAVKDVVINNGIAYFANEGTGGACLDGTWAARLSTGSLVWLNQCLGATQAVAVVGNYLYKASHAHDCQLVNTNGDLSNFPDITKGNPRHLLAQQLSNGFLGPWYPDVNGGPNFGPRAFATDGSQLYVGGDFTVVNGTSQQGIARFDTNHDIPPPMPAAPTVSSSTPGTVKVSAQAPVDPDNPALTMELYRNGDLVASTRVTSLFWKQPTIHWTETGLASNTSYTFAVKAVETSGGVASPVSNPAAVTVACASSLPARGQVLTVKSSATTHSKRVVSVRVCVAERAVATVIVTSAAHSVHVHTERTLARGVHTISVVVPHRAHLRVVRVTARFSRAGKRASVVRSLELSH